MGFRPARYLEVQLLVLAEAEAAANQQHLEPGEQAVVAMVGLFTQMVATQVQPITVVAAAVVAVPMLCKRWRRWWWWGGVRVGPSGWRGSERKEGKGWGTMPEESYGGGNQVEL